MTGNTTQKQATKPDLQKAFLRHVPGRVAAIIENWHLLVRTGWDQENLNKLIKRLQALVVLTNKLGLERTSRVSRSLMKHLQTAFAKAENSMPSEVIIRELDAIFLAFSEAVHNEQQPKQKVMPANRRKHNRNTQASTKPCLYLFGFDEKRIKGLSQLLEELDIRCRVFDNGEKLFAEMAKQPAVALICHVRSLENLLPEQRRGKAEERPHPPIIAIADSDDLKLRLQAMRAGADLYLTEPLDVARFSSEIHQLLYREEHSPNRVLVVEDDPAQADYAMTILLKAGYEIQVVTDPFKVLQAIELFHPDLVLMDLYMPGVSGIELTAIIEERTEFADIPIIFLSGEQSVDVQLEALSVGGEDFLAKPIGPKQLISAVHNRIKRAEKRHQRLGRSKRRDQVTGLFSRNYLLERLNRVLMVEKASHKPMGLLFIEIDSPDLILERIGIGGVDAVLAEIGELLERQTSETDLSARFGDYSFTILTTQHKPEKLTAMAEGIRSIIADHLFDLGTLSATATVSVGILPLRTWGVDSSVALTRVKAVTNLAKDNGGNQVRLYAVNTEPTDNDDQWILELVSEALREKLFEVHYQPMVALHGMAGEFYQALIRLRTAEQELIPAGKFIPAAEQHGLINEIDRWVTERSLKVLAERKNIEQPIRLFVCQSASSIHDHLRLVWLEKMLSGRDIGFNHLTFEFKLGDVKADLAAAKEFFEALHDLKVSTLISEFTDNAESFQVLKHLPTRFVKIDQSCLKSDENRQAPMIKKLHAAKMVVIAPCVEDPATIAQLWTLEADFVQGYFIQMPGNSLGYDFKDSILH